MRGGQGKKLCGNRTQNQVSREKMESLRGVKRLENPLEERERSEEFDQCVLCKGKVLVGMESASGSTLNFL